ASQDGRVAILARTQQRSTTFAIVSPRHERVVRLGGNRWSFDALNGDNLFLVRALRVGYQIRLLHLESGVLQREPLKDERDDATLTGVPWSRTPSADGRYLYTLYVGPNGDAMVHVLDTEAATAHCVDLPGSGDFNAASSYAVVVDPDGRHLWAVSPGYGRVVHVDVLTHRVVDAYRFDASAAWNTNVGIAALAPDGERLAVTDGYHLWFVELAQRKVIAAPPHVAVALGYSPDLERLWVVGERSRVSALRAR
ncbi:MAG: YncE family protein, partial [Gaiellaceae bacterium]